MATFILIHGSWHGGWCFERLHPLLEQAGHVVIAPDLPGMGGNEAVLRAVTLRGWTEFTADLCRNASNRPVILVGHSRGGLVLSQAAETAPEAIDALVYVCAMMLPDGMSRVDLKVIESANPQFDAIVKPVYGGAGTRIKTQGAAAVFAQLSPEPWVSNALRRLVTEPSAPRTMKLALTPARFGRVPRHYVECTEDRTMKIETQRLMQKLVPGARITTLHSDHSPYLCRPEELAAVLLAAIPRP